ncbi:transmembrane protein 141 [Sardina pilchardus]|uniref:transmembrane protein 141 n=1 Tax=Sardina pilchardus TaxID=27697 RepID=UPI002E1671C1
MVNIGLTKVDDALVAKHPGLQRYAACQSHAFMKGVGTVFVGTGGLFLIQRALQTRLPYPLQWNLLVSIVSASVGSYAITRWETQKCTDYWYYLEKGSYPDKTVPQEEPPAAPAAPAAPAGPKVTVYGDRME